METPGNESVFVVPPCEEPARAIDEALERATTGSRSVIVYRAASMVVRDEDLRAAAATGLAGFALAGVAGTRFGIERNFTSGSPFLHWRLDVGEHRWGEGDLAAVRTHGPSRAACAAVHPDLILLDAAALRGQRLSTSLPFDLAVAELCVRLRKRGMPVGVLALPHRARTEPATYRRLAPEEARLAREALGLPPAPDVAMGAWADELLAGKEPDVSRCLAREFPKLRWDGAEELLLHHAEMRRLRATRTAAGAPGRPYILVGPRYDAKSGGAVALHLLAAELRRAGAEAYLFPGALAGSRQSYLASPYDIHISPVLHELMAEGILVYPEVVDGNPLHGRRVCRWLLNKPGVVGGNGVFGPDDLIFHYQDYFVPEGAVSAPLRVMDLHLELFHDRDVPARRGTCYTIRKRKDARIVHDLQDSVEIVDSSPRPELAELFRSRERFYSYDTATYLFMQAALCGCLPVVIPEPGLSKDEWRAKYELFRYGIAYGEDDIPRALETMPRVRPHLENLRDRGRDTVAAFVELTRSRWP